MIKARLSRRRLDYLLIAGLSSRRESPTVIFTPGLGSDCGMITGYVLCAVGDPDEQHWIISGTEMKILLIELWII